MGARDKKRSTAERALIDVVVLTCSASIHLVPPHGWSTTRLKPVRVQRRAATKALGWATRTSRRRILFFRMLSTDPFLLLWYFGFHSISDGRTLIHVKSSGARLSIRPPIILISLISHATPPLGNTSTLYVHPKMVDGQELKQTQNRL